MLFIEASIRLDGVQEFAIPRNFVRIPRYITEGHLPLAEFRFINGFFVEFDDVAMTWILSDSFVQRSY